MAQWRLKPEVYRGQVIKFTQRLIKGVNTVIARWQVGKRVLEISGRTKFDAFTRMKRIIDGALRR